MVFSWLFFFFECFCVMVIYTFFSPRFLSGFFVSFSEVVVWLSSSFQVVFKWFYYGVVLMFCIGFR